MSDGILVKPAQLRECAGNLKSGASTIQGCVEAVDSAIQSLSGRFEGMSADEIRSRYAQARERIESFRPLIDKFAKELEATADRFEKADKAISG